MTPPNHRQPEYHTALVSKWFQKAGKTDRFFRSYMGQIYDKIDGVTVSRQPTLKQLKYLCCRRAPAFRSGGQGMHVSQSTLSASIVELEDVLSASLVERNNRSVLLTALGNEVVARARRSPDRCR